MPQEFFVESFVESLFKICDGSIGLSVPDSWQFSKTFLVLPKRARPPRLDLRGGLIVSNPGRRKGGPLSEIVDSQMKEISFDCSAGTFHASSGETTLLSRSGDRIPPRSGFILLDWKVSNIGGRDPSTYIPMREFRGTLRLSPCCSPFYPVWFQRVSKILNWGLGWHCGPGDRFLTDSVWFGVEWQIWEARSCSLLMVDVVVSPPSFISNISRKRRLIMFHPGNRSYQLLFLYL